MKVRFAPEAHADLAAIRDWIARDDERAARRVVVRILRAAAMFRQFPMLGPEGRVPGTREFLVVGLPYRIVYRVASSDEVIVLAVVHVRRRYPAE